MSLSNEDYNEFLNLNSQLSDLFPTLTKQYDSNGNAILNLGSNAQSVTKKIKNLADQQERLVNGDVFVRLSLQDIALRLR